MFDIEWKRKFRIDALIHSRTKSTIMKKQCFDWHSLSYRIIRIERHYPNIFRFGLPRVFYNSDLLLIVNFQHLSIRYQVYLLHFSSKQSMQNVTRNRKMIVRRCTQAGISLLPKQQKHEHDLNFEIHNTNVLSYSLQISSALRHLLGNQLRIQYLTSKNITRKSDIDSRHSYNSYRELTWTKYCLSRILDKITLHSFRSEISKGKL